MFWLIFYKITLWSVAFFSGDLSLIFISRNPWSSPTLTTSWLFDALEVEMRPQARDTEGQVHVRLQGISMVSYQVASGERDNETTPSMLQLGWHFRTCKGLDIPQNISRLEALGRFNHSGWQKPPVSFWHKLHTMIPSSVAAMSGFGIFCQMLRCSTKEHTGVFGAFLAWSVHFCQTSANWWVTTLFTDLTLWAV